MEVCIAILHDSQYNDLWGSVKQLLEEKVFPTYFLTILLIVSRCKWNCTVCSSCDNLLVRVDMKLVPILSTFEVYTNSVKKQNQNEIQSQLYLEALNLTDVEIMKETTILKYQIL